MTTLEPSLEEKVLSELRRVEGVKEAYAVYGVDVSAKIEADSLQELKGIVSFEMEAERR